LFRLIGGPECEDCGSKHYKKSAPFNPIWWIGLSLSLGAATYGITVEVGKIRFTPAMQLGVTDHVWSIGELIDAALAGEVPEGSGPEFPHNLDRKDTLQSVRYDGQFKGRFTVIKGGKE
jgi:hypothetical protein